MKGRLALAQRRLEITKEGQASQLAPQEADVNSKKAEWELQNKASSTISGSKPACPAFSSSCRSSAARRSPRARTWRASPIPNVLKAELRIAETQTKDIHVGQVAEVDTRNGIVKGHVARIDPSSVGGTVGVDVTMDGPMPPGSRPDLSVDGTIQLERLDNVIYVGRPAFGQENSTVDDLQGPGRTAMRCATKVKLGRARSIRLRSSRASSPATR